MTETITVQMVIQRTLAVYRDPAFVTWANLWLSAADRSEISATAIAQTIEATSWPGDGDWSEGQAASAAAEESWGEPSALMAVGPRAAVYAAKAAAAAAAGRAAQAEAFSASALDFANKAALRLPPSLRQRPTP